MAIFKCKMCGGTLNVNEGTTVCECEYCGTAQTLPKLDNAKRNQLFDRANHYRMNKEFDKASFVYENIISEAPNEAEAHWGMCLCRYGIEYVVDPKTNKRIPTCHRTQFKSILEDDDYLSAVKNCDGIAREIYNSEAMYIDNVQKQILEISSKEEPFDIFICYKESDNAGSRTTDSVIAQDIYNELTTQGYNVFFARITLEDKLGSAYEPYIFAALNSSKIMLVVGTKLEYFNAVWVKNEWSRYLSLIEQGQKKTLIPCYRDITPYDLPDEFVALQSQDVSKVGYMQDLMRGIEKILGKTTSVLQLNANTSSLIKRAFMFLEDEKWNSAEEYCEKVLDIDPECAEAYLGKLMAYLKVNKEEELAHIKTDYSEFDNYKKAIRFGCDRLEKYSKKSRYRIATGMKIESINEDDYQKAGAMFLALGDFQDAKTKYYECQKNIYNIAASKMAKAKVSEDWNEAKNIFLNLGDFEDAKKQAIRCTYESQKSIYNIAVSKMVEAKIIQDWNEAKEIFLSLGSFEDAENKVNLCNEKITLLLRKETTEKISDACILMSTMMNSRINLGKKLLTEVIAESDFSEEKEIAKQKLMEIEEERKKCEIIKNELEREYNEFVDTLKYMRMHPRYLRKKKNRKEEDAFIDKHKNMVKSLSLELVRFEDKRKKICEKINIDNILNKYIHNINKETTIGDIVKFGQYGQYGRNINWVVVKKEGNLITIVSESFIRIRAWFSDKYCLHTDVQWSKSDIRSFLNNELYNSFFTCEEKDAILVTSLKDVGTNDKIYILSTNEVNQYFPYIGLDAVSIIGNHILIDTLNCTGVYQSHIDPNVVCPLRCSEIANKSNISGREDWFMKTRFDGYESYFPSDHGVGYVRIVTKVDQNRIKNKE